MDLRMTQKFLMSLVVIVTCTSVLSLERRGKHTVTTSDSSHPSQWTRSSRHRDSTGREGNGITTESGRKVSQVLTDDHQRLDLNHDKDEALWDDGILMSSAGHGKERKSGRGSNADDDDEKKTLSQQVKEGKYGLIQNEIYPEEPKRPGIISYLSNPEVPKDTAKNLGGLDEDEIWLAENHVLVLRGGNFPENKAENHDAGSQKWPPIDDYEAPRRQIKIPHKPKVPPPFPIQLTEGGPIQIIGSNGTASGQNATLDFESIAGSKGYLPGEGPFFSFPPTDTLSSPGTVTTINGTRGNLEKTNSEPPDGVSGPFYPALPPGAVFVPPPGNQSDYDDDDQSIYYPPPYSFFYPQDNATAIPPGPLVPGIILPPPPDFFSSLDVKKSATKGKTKRPTTTPLPKSRPTYLPPTKTGTKLYKMTTATTLSPIKVGTVPVRSKIFDKAAFKNSTQVTVHKPLFVEVTTPASERSTTHAPDNFVIRPAFGNAIETSTEKSRWTPVVSSKRIPLATYYASTIPSLVDQPVEAKPVPVKSIDTTKHSGRVPSQASYYFYEEAKDDSTTVNPSLYYRSTTKAPFFKAETVPQEVPQERKKYYSVEMLPSRQTSKNLSVKLIDSLVKDPQVFEYTDAGSVTPTKYEIPTKYDSRTKYETPTTYETQTNYDTSTKYDSRTKYETPTKYETQTNYDTSTKYEIPTKYETPTKYDSRTKYETPTKYETQSNYDTSTKYETPTKYESPIKHELRAKYEKPPVLRSESPRMISDSPPLYYETLSGRSPLKLSSYYNTPKPKTYYREPVTEDYSQEQKSNPKPIYQYSFEAAGYTKRGKQEKKQQPEQQEQDLTLYNEYQDIQSVSDHYDYLGTEAVPEQQLRTERVPYRTPAFHSTTVSPIIDTTMDPHQAYFTKQEEQLLDDVTKEYFTVFGKKLTGRAQSTTPLYGKSSSVTEKPRYGSTFVSNDYADDRYKTSKVKVHYGDQSQGPYSLKEDTLVNYKHPLPTIDPDSEFITVVGPQRASPEFRVQQILPVQNQVRDFQPTQGRSRYAPIRNYGSQRIQQSHQNSEEFVPIVDPRKRVYPSSLEGDTAVNYRDPRPPINPDAEFVTPVRTLQPGKTSSYFAYRLPGDGGHFYFLTPQTIAQRQDSGGFLYAKPRTPRLLRQRRGLATNV